MSYDAKSAPAPPKENDLDPRIQIELEKLNNATDEINRLEMELDEANSTFRILMSESMRKLKLLTRKLGSSCIERARPYYDALELSKQAQQECQRAAVKFQRANEIHQAAKETVALAEARFLSKQHEWEFDSAWQEMLNNAIMRVTDAEHQKAESGREHQRRTTLFHAAEQKVQLLEQRCHRHIAKSRPYFEEKIRCETQLSAQKEKVLKLRAAITKSKNEYASSLRRLEDISEEIHLKRKGSLEQKSRSTSPCGPREPGVGAELDSTANTETTENYRHLLPTTPEHPSGTRSPSLDLDCDLDRCDIRSIGSGSVATSSAVSDDEFEPEASEDLEELKQKVRELATRPVLKQDYEADGSKKAWESELNVAVQKLDHVMHLQECEKELQKQTDG
ncbi:SH3 domain-binding protein 5 homolog [Planococcus citri]|uniref:SH3 domain-binding protein 5 homolog n=1 Tax=Planococcus citri TaxID=170843 RepID=UPI0031F8399F